MILYLSLYPISESEKILASNSISSKIDSIPCTRYLIAEGASTDVNIN